MRIYSWFCALSVLTGAACGASTQGERVRNARMEQIDEQSVEKTRVIEDRLAAREQAIGQNHDLAKANLAKGEGSSQSMSDAALDMAQERALYDAQARGRVDTIAVRIGAARKKLGALNGKAPADMRARVEVLESVQERVATEIRELSLTPDAKWEAAKQRVDHSISSLDERVDDFTAEL